MKRGFVVLAGIALIAAGAWWFVEQPGDRFEAVAPSAPSAPSAETGELPGIPDDAFEMVVESVHDGDTLRARVITPNDVVTDLESTRVRLIGVDTPEISDPAECWGDEATVSLTELAPVGSTILVAADREVLDQYDRHLLYLWTPEGDFINGALVARGDAMVMMFAPNDGYESVFRGLEREASDAGLGLWGSCR